MLTGNQPLPRLARTPWNKGRLIGQKRPLKPKDVWAIRVRLQLEQRKRDLALFNLAIDSKLRGCHLVRLRANDVCVGGQVRDRATVIQQKTGRPVQFEITEQTRAAIRDWLADTGPATVDTSSRADFTASPHIYSTIRSDRPSLGRARWSRQLGLRDSLAAANQGGTDLQEDRQLEGGAATARSHGILPANTRRKPRSTTLTIRNSVRVSSSEGVSSRTTSKWQSSCSPTARLPACQRGCSPNWLHNTEYADPQRFQLHFCSLCVSKSMRS